MAAHKGKNRNSGKRMGEKRAAGKRAAAKRQVGNPADGDAAKRAGTRRYRSRKAKPAGKTHLKLVSSLPASALIRKAR